PYGIASGPNGELWFTEQGVSNIGEMRTDGTLVREWPVSIADLGLDAIVAGPDGNVWFTEENANAIGRLDPRTGIVTEFADDGAAPGSITGGPDGALWFLEESANSIGRLDPANPGAGITHFPVPTNPAFTTGAPPTGITAGPDGNIWFTENSAKTENGPSPVHKIGRLTLVPGVTAVPKAAGSKAARRH
ncbi:MAG TPA: hypothetical protein VKL22_06170, partial [Actinomycetota bacterium]|nr:hypothetical protein [Actinomycetota bacterium]